MFHNLYDPSASQNVPSDTSAAISQPIEKPFLIELRQERHSKNNSFVPATSLHLTSSLRTSGLLHALEPDALKNLLYLLTFLTPEGHAQASLFHLAKAMQVSQSKAKARMQRLAQVQWDGEAVVVENRSESGYIAYSVHPRLIIYRHASTPDQPESPRFNSRERIIEYSRQHYARPRAEAERLVARQLGHDENESDEERRLRYRLENNGLNSEQARALILSHDAELIKRQLEWLPYRNAKNPAGYLKAAIEGDYEEPRALHSKRSLQERANQEHQEQVYQERVSQEQIFREPQSQSSSKEQWQDGQIQALESKAVSNPVTLLPEDDFMEDDSTDEETPDEEITLEEVMDKADALAPEDRWISLTPDE